MEVPVVESPKSRVSSSSSGWEQVMPRLPVGAAPCCALKTQSQCVLAEDGADAQHYHPLRNANASSVLSGSEYNKLDMMFLLAAQHRGHFDSVRSIFIHASWCFAHTVIVVPLIPWKQGEVCVQLRYEEYSCKQSWNFQRGNRGCCLFIKVQ